MGVSTRNIILAGAALSSLAIISGAAIAGGGMGSGSGCGSSCGGSGSSGGMSGPGAVFPGSPGVIIPGAGIGQPNISFGGANGGGMKGGMVPNLGVAVPGVNIAGPNINVGGPNINVGGSTLVTNNTNVLDSGLVVQTGRTDDTFIAGGGGYYTPIGTPPSLLQFEGETETYTDTVTEQVPTTEEYCADQITQVSAIRPVQAVCIDDKGSPHPASRPDSSKRVSGSYSGEIFRCMSGTKMQVTLGRLDGTNASFDRAETFSCRKGEALVHRPGGELVCAPQIPQRNCNERSLLRRNGPGIKLVETRGQRRQCIPQTRTSYQTVERQVQRTRQKPGSTLVLDGGVGNGIY